MGEDETADLVVQMFALLTAKFEDGAVIAANGQASGEPPADQRGRAARLHELGRECMLVADAIQALAPNLVR